MNRRRVLVNVGLGAVVLGLGVAGLVSLVTPRANPYANLPTAKVVRGALEATVTASGNASNGITSTLQLAGSGGVVTKVYVKTGQQVTAGDRLVKIDDTAARQQLASARATLASAEASMTTATQGRTSAEKTSDSASIATAEQALKNAQNALVSAQASYDLVKRQQSQLVASAQGSVDAARQALNDAEQQLADAKAQLAATDPSDTAAIAELQTKIGNLQTRIATDQTTLATAQNSLAAAQRASDSQLLAAGQAVTTQRGSRDSAKKSLAQTRATVAVSEQGAKPGTLQSAQAQIDSARVAVDQARTAVEHTVLRAPFSGTVSTVNAVVGQSSSAISGASASGTSASGGLVTLVDPNGKTVTASIAEADATSVEVGQPVSVVLEASSLQLKGTVASIDPASTVTNNVVQYQTRIALESPPASVRDGQTASISITTGTKENVLFVPTSAIATDGNQPYVMKMVAGSPVRTNVTTGMTGTTGTEITGGLAEGDSVLLSNTGETSTGLFPRATASSTAR
jgi:HlyD family secretion protein